MQNTECVGSAVLFYDCAAKSISNVVKHIQHHKAAERCDGKIWFLKYCFPADNVALKLQANSVTPHTQNLRKHIND